MVEVGRDDGGRPYAVIVAVVEDRAEHGAPLNLERRCERDRLVAATRARVHRAEVKKQRNIRNGGDRRGRGCAPVVERETPGVVPRVGGAPRAGPGAGTIQRRGYALDGGEERTPRPEEILGTSDEQFRGAGVSRQKASYLRDLAEHVVSGGLNLDALDGIPDDEVTEALTAVHGIGEWSADMFLMFELGRPDVLPVGDLGVRNGMRIAYGLNEAPTQAQAHKIGEPWTPYRTVGSWYMWRAAETVTPDA